MIFFNMKVYCVFSLESPRRGDSNEYTQNTISQYEKENHPTLSQFCSYGIFSRGPKNEFETAMVNEPSVFEPLKFNCIKMICIQTVFFGMRYLEISDFEISRPDWNSKIRILFSRYTSEDHLLPKSFLGQQEKMGAAGLSKSDKII